MYAMQLTEARVCFCPFSTSGASQRGLVMAGTLLATPVPVSSMNLLRLKSDTCGDVRGGVWAGGAAIMHYTCSAGELAALQCTGLRGLTSQRREQECH